MLKRGGRWIGFFVLVAAVGAIVYPKFRHTSSERPQGGENVCECYLANKNFQHTKHLRESRQKPVFIVRKFRLQEHNR